MNLIWWILKNWRRISIYGYLKYINFGYMSNIYFKGGLMSQSVVCFFPLEYEQL